MLLQPSVKLRRLRWRKRWFVTFIGNTVPQSLSQLDALCQWQGLYGFEKVCIHARYSSLYL